MKKITILAIALLLTACATQNDKWEWFKPNSSQQEFNMDDAQCRAQAFSLVGAPMIQRVIVLQNCMMGKGWEKQAVY